MASKVMKGDKQSLTLLSSMRSKAYFKTRADEAFALPSFPEALSQFKEERRQPTLKIEDELRNKVTAEEHINTDVEHLKQTMIQHEAMFKQQLHELHRLYQVQRSLNAGEGTHELAGSPPFFGSSGSLLNGSLIHRSGPLQTGKPVNLWSLSVGSNSSVDQSNQMIASSNSIQCSAPFTFSSAQESEHDPQKNLSCVPPKRSCRLFDLEQPAELYMDSEDVEDEMSLFKIAGCPIRSERTVLGHSHPVLLEKDTNNTPQTEKCVSGFNGRINERCERHELLDHLTSNKASHFQEEQSMLQYGLPALSTQNHSGGFLGSRQENDLVSKSAATNFQVRHFHTSVAMDRYQSLDILDMFSQVRASGLQLSPTLVPHEPSTTKKPFQLDLNHKYFCDPEEEGMLAASSGEVLTSNNTMSHLMAFRNLAPVNMQSIAQGGNTTNCKGDIRFIPKITQEESEANPCAFKQDEVTVVRARLQPSTTNRLIHLDLNNANSNSGSFGFVDGGRGVVDKGSNFSGLTCCKSGESVDKANTGSNTHQSFDLNLLPFQAAMAAASTNMKVEQGVELRCEEVLPKAHSPDNALCTSSRTMPMKIEDCKYVHGERGDEGSGSSLAEDSSGCVNGAIDVLLSFSACVCQGRGEGVSEDTEKDKDTQYRKDLDAFESATLLLKAENLDTERASLQDIPRLKLVENCPPSQALKSRSKRRRVAKDFQRAILPTISSLSRQEINKDLNSISELFKAASEVSHSSLRDGSMSKTVVTWPTKGHGRAEHFIIGNTQACKVEDQRDPLKLCSWVETRRRCMRRSRGLMLHTSGHT